MKGITVNRLREVVGQQHWADLPNGRRVKILDEDGTETCIMGFGEDRGTIVLLSGRLDGDYDDGPEEDVQEEPFGVN